LRKDSLSHAYELMKVEDPKKRRRLAAQVARGELTLIKLRDKIEGRRARPAGEPVEDVPTDTAPIYEPEPGRAVSVTEDEGWTTESRAVAISDDSLVNAKQDLADAVEQLVSVLRSPELRGSIPQTDRANLAKYLTIAKLKLENAIAIVRSDNPDY
jgi:hypothetical protein